MMTDQQLLLLQWVMERHDGQKRKGTDYPYWFHLLKVGLMAPLNVKYGFEIGICHDLLEDTDTSTLQLGGKLAELGYSLDEAGVIAARVAELTSVYSKEEYPHLNRAERKKREAARLSKVSPTSQTIKYCDIIDNLSNIDILNSKFAKTYKAEKRKTLLGMMDGDYTLHKKALELTQ